MNNQKKQQDSEGTNKIIWAIVLAVVVIAAILLITRTPSRSSSTAVGQNYNVSIDKGVQIIELKAKGGYTPNVTLAKAGIPTILRMETNGTFDCSSSIRIPSMNISENLPRTGATDIDLGTPTAGVFRGSCGMGMYPFEIDFQS